MFLVRVVGVTEIVVDGDGFDDASDSISAEGCDTRGDEGRTDGEVLAQLVVERTNAFRFGRHCCLPVCCAVESRFAAQDDAWRRLEFD